MILSLDYINELFYAGEIINHYPKIVTEWEVDFFSNIVRRIILYKQHTFFTYQEKEVIERIRKKAYDFQQLISD